nr:toll/interleukin-1 receptor domain-containing protein [Chloroflexota bacterium]
MLQGLLGSKERVVTEVRQERLLWFWRCLMGRIFISHSRVDRPFVDTLVPLLDKGYASMRFDENLHGGQEWWKEILHHI